MLQEFTKAELAAVIAGIRCLQRYRDGSPTVHDDGIADIETNMGAHSRLSMEALDRLAERVNTSEAKVQVVVVMEGGLMSESVASHPVTLINIDRDTQGADPDDIEAAEDRQGKVRNCFFYVGPPEVDRKYLEVLQPKIAEALGDDPDQVAGMISSERGHYRAVLEEIEADEDACTCDVVSWVGQGHASSCLLQIASNALNLEGARKPKGKIGRRHSTT